MNGSQLVIALVGNPNSGKSTVFNAITGMRQHVGNYPGVTVEPKEGLAVADGRTLKIVDLPGTYSLTPHGGDERAVCQFIRTQSPDLVVNIIDCSNLERNLYLTTQLMELGVPLLLAFNMSDLAEAKGFRVDDARLCQLLGVPIVRTVGNKGRGIDELMAKAVSMAAASSADLIAAQRRVDYGSEIEPHIDELEKMIRDSGIPGRARWLAIRLLEADADVAEIIRTASPNTAGAIIELAEKLRTHIAKVCGAAAEIILADRRYGFISGACTESIKLTVESRHEYSDRIDSVMLHPLLGLPVFAFMMFLVFQMTFWLGNPLVDLLETLKIAAAEAVRSHFDGLAGSLLADGVIEGVGSVLQFVPLIGLLYIAMAILEDSGYMARAAFVMDRFMHRIGLHGKSAIPMLLGFGCTVPAVMATRMLDNRADRLTTMMVLPLMSCGARLPVYFLILGALFPSRELFNVAGVGVTNQATILFAMYLTGIVLAVFSVWLLRKTIFKSSDSHFVMELPPYRWPTLRGMLIHGGQMTWHYVKKAGTVIFIVAVILWAMKTWPVAPQATELAAQSQLAQNADAKNDLLARAEKSQLENSAIGQVGKMIAPVFAPCGLDWKVSTALVGALAAKEVFVTQLGVMYSTSADETGEKLSAKISTDYTPLQGIVMMLFILIASPCMGTLVVVARQAGSWRWAALQWLYLTVLAWVVCVGVYQIGGLCGAG